MRKTIQVRFLHNSTLQAREIITQRTTTTSMMDFSAYITRTNSKQYNTKNIFYLCLNDNAIHII